MAACIAGLIQAVKWARYPPVARRSAGAGQAASIWGINGINYRQTFNDNMLVVIMIETPTGAANAYDIASVPGVDVVIIGNNDLSSFSGFPQNDDRYQQLMNKIHDETLHRAAMTCLTAASMSRDPESGPPAPGVSPASSASRLTASMNLLAHLPQNNIV